MSRSRRLFCVGIASLLMGPALFAAATNTAASAKGSGNGILSDDGREVAVRASAALAQGANSFRGTGAAGAGRVSANRVRPAAGVHPSSVIGFDGRVQDTTTTGYPDRATVEILFQQTVGGSWYVCSGFFVGPDTVVTAGHCVHSGTGGVNGFYVRTSYQIRPGRNGANVPYTCPGNVTVGAQRLFTNNGWANGGGETVDYAAIHTTCPIGNTVGWYGYSNTSSLATLNNIPMDNRGYPADKPAGTQWVSENCKASAAAAFLQCKVAATQARQIFYANDSFGGQSGSPVFRDGSAPAVGGCSGAACVYAIHAYGVHGAAPHSTLNHGTRIENQVTNFISFVRNGGVLGTN